ncbi:DUF5131 family protein [Haloarcula sp. JP-L23]|uniref:DUF5131 family protein n=1 Tax=Haloarcula sp. JP-L23 TaxID=2716717 RepID=UPI00140EBAA6|nr:DUF5131 family protein [Haloarcula sp. JP-L23]
MQESNISWTDYTWNPVTGCSRAGPECYDSETDTLVCYAERYTREKQAAREDAPEYVSDAPWTQANAAEVVTTHEGRLDAPFEYHFPAGPGRVFVCSMSDLFHEQVPTAFIRQVIAVARQCPEHVWILLTKRPSRAAGLDIDWPANVWLGTSVGSGPGGTYPDTTHRIDELRSADAATLWVSFEPLIEPIGDVDLSGFDWAVVGGESRASEYRREMEHAWARDLLTQCREQGVRFHFKQSSAPRPGMKERLTVENEDYGVFEQRKIREYPPVPDVTERARQELIA